MTAQQMNTLRFLAVGKTNRQIASQLEIEENTVRINLSAILKNLGVETRIEAVLVALRDGMVTNAT